MYKTADLLELSKISKSTYYYTLKQLDKPDKNAEIKKKLKRFTTNTKGVTVIVELRRNYEMTGF